VRDYLRSNALIRYAIAVSERERSFFSMFYQKSTAVLLFASASLMIFCSVSCQPSVNPSALPSAQSSPIQPSASPTPKGEMTNVTLCPACHGEYKVLPGNQTCPATPNCPAVDPRVRPMPPLAIDASKYTGLKQEFKLSDIQAPAESLGGLQPPPVIAHATISGCESGQGLYPEGGLSNSCSALLLEKNGQTSLIDTAEKFRQAFAPVESAEEALAFASGLTNAFGIYEFDKRSPGRSDQGSIDLRPEYLYYSSSLVPTTVTKEGQDYIVQLFKYQEFGCQHPYSALSYRVTPAGVVTEIKNQLLVRDPNRDGICVD
jgi:hypothetical protein